VQFSSLHPLIKLAAWVALLAGLAFVVQGFAWLCGLEFNVLDGDHGGRGILLTLAVLSLVVIMSADRQPISEYGLIVGPKWKKLWRLGVAAGGMSFLLLMAVAVVLGTTSLSTDSLTAGSWVKASVVALVTAIPLALTQQVIFNGYLLSTLRKGMNRILAVLVCATLFAVIGRLNEPQLLMEANTLSLMLGLFLTASFLGLLRLATGSVVLPAGILAGWIFLSRTAAKLELFATDYTNAATSWLVPGGEPRRSPAMWGVLAIASAVTWLWIRRRGEPRVAADQAAIHSEFKRTFPLSHVSASTPLDVWLRLFSTARFRVGAEYVGRLVFVLVCSTVVTILSLPERLLFPLLLRQRAVRDPIFILGVHRSGTTHLHNLLSRDPRFFVPRNYHVLRPIGYLLTGSLLTPVAALFARGTRPMDNMQFSLFTPAEEEFSIAASSSLSPYWGMTFPQLWPTFEKYIFPDQLSATERDTWKRTYQFMLSKMTLLSPKRQPLLKNPYNTGRVAVLREMYPRAKFIHISRHPYDVYRSNMHMADEAHVINPLQSPDPATSYQKRFLDNYAAMEGAYDIEISRIPVEDVCELRFEDLERDPIGQLQYIYQELGLEWTERFERRLRKYLRSVSDYKKNAHGELPRARRAQIDLKMGAFMQRWRYETTAGNEPAGHAA